MHPVQMQLKSGLDIVLYHQSTRKDEGIEVRMEPGPLQRALGPSAVEKERKVSREKQQRKGRWEERKEEWSGGGGRAGEGWREGEKKRENHTPG